MREYEILILVLVLFLIGFLVLFIFYLLTLRAALKSVSPELRRTSPDNVFLMLIPFFSIVYQFFLVAYVADSIEAELKKRQIRYDTPRPTYSIGITFCVLFVVSIIPIPVINSLVSLAGLVCWIVHWVKVNEYKNMLTRPSEVPLDQNI